LLDLLSMKKDLSSQELSMLESEFRRRKKSRVVLWLLWWFTGIIGGHRYYLGDKGRAIAQTIVFLLSLFVEVIFLEPAGFSLLIIPALWALVDAFFIGHRLAQKNEEIEINIINEIKSSRSTTAPPTL